MSVYNGLPLSSTVYHCLKLLTYVYQRVPLFTLVNSCLPLITALSQSTTIYHCLQLFIIIYHGLQLLLLYRAIYHSALLFTADYPCTPLSTSFTIICCCIPIFSYLHLYLPQLPPSITVYLCHYSLNTTFTIYHCLPLCTVDPYLLLSSTRKLLNTTIIGPHLSQFTNM